MSEPPPIARWEWCFCVVIAVATLCLGMNRLAYPSLWHDELVHVFVAKSIAATGIPELPSGHFYTSGTLFNFILGAFIFVFGDGERVVRTPSALFTAASVLIALPVLRPLSGRGPALVAVVAFALSPWTIAWAREARFYALQQFFYLIVIGASWRVVAPYATHRLRWFVALTVAYALGLATAFHSILFLGPILAYTFLHALWFRADRKTMTAILMGAGVLVAITFVGYFISLPQADRDAIFAMGSVAGGIGDEEIYRWRDPIREDKLFYGQWLMRNHSVGFLLLAILGAMALPMVKGRRGLFTVIAFAVPFIALSFLITYRRPRFIYFAFPFYLALSSFAFCVLCAFMARCREHWWRGLASVFILIFMFRLGLSTTRLTADTLETAAGADITLARRHPQWRQPAQFVGKTATASDAILSTTYLPVLYYAGRCTETFPTKMIVWEYIESGSKGLADVEALQAFVAENPSGYFLAEWQRFGRWPQLAPEKDWVREHMEIVPKVSNQDITVYRWPRGQE